MVFSDVGRFLGRTITFSSTGEAAARTDECAGMRRPPEVMIWRSGPANSLENLSASPEMLLVEDMIIDELEKIGER